MISFSKISKQYGKQVLFVDASFQLNPGEQAEASRAVAIDSRAKAPGRAGQRLVP